MARYTKPELREKLKEEIKASDRGGRPGQWSARKSQLLTQEYQKHGGGYQGPKDERQKSLQHWGDQKWRNRKGTTRARHDGETDRYLPDQAWNQLSAEQQRATDARKRKESKSGKQYVANTGPARRARRNAAAVPLNEMPVAEATRHVRDLDTNQLRAALRAERAGKARKTLIQRLQSALDRR
ncbi:hypothetical protein SAMN05443287_10627 [Micromonospora phaseoli]|uniref:DUF5872 domain-containing protein n=1 Tax=Micromonospora phaseoli TaxID=1144548 RepID=A0A1H7AP51_9ACTN|nr:hypothetical protein [Micromonospora phaseoli]PZV96481.1 hypothetical protein CLV64_107361 [Micromonospora phaseoli]GIJ76169.1 hypothetical protein Xph01_06010 [Micromonospora phaseoli]SEJ62795.1 hypothetical protein SAMN05443287_10627 [Micromonospora phaseoli]